MGVLHRRQLILSIGLIIWLLMLARCVMHPNESARVHERLEPTSVHAVSASSQPPESIQITSEIASGPTLDASRFGTLRGRVIDAVTWQPVQEFEVQFHGTQRTKMGDEAPGMRTFKSADGRFEWEYLPPGKWMVTASAPGYQRFETSGLRIRGGQTTAEIVLPMRPGEQLRGRVYDEVSGAGITAASVGFRESDQGRFEGNWRSRVRVTTAQDGSFVLDGVPPGRVTLEVSASDHAARELEVAVGDAPPLEIGLSAGGTIAGRLTAADGVTPVAGMVGLFRVDEGFGGSIRTTAAGEFSFRHLSEGRYELTGQAEGGSIAHEIVLARNQHVDGLVLALAAGHTIRGLVTGLSPEDLERLRIMLHRDGSALSSYEGVAVDEHGAYALHGVAPGRVHVLADVTMRRQIARTIEVPVDSDVTLNIDFPAGARLSGRVTRAGEPLSGVWLNPRPSVEQPVHIYGTSTSRNGEVCQPVFPFW